MWTMADHVSTLQVSVSKRSGRSRSVGTEHIVVGVVKLANESSRTMYGYALMYFAEVTVLDTSGLCWKDGGLLRLVIHSAGPPC